PGLDGRKMSKSYDNTIPLFAPPAELRKLIFSIVTDSRAPGEPKDTEGSALFQLYQAFATPAQTEEFAKAFAAGIGWGDAKQALFERIDAEVAPMRARYDELVAKPVEIEAILREGAIKARKVATPLLLALREAVGLRDLRTQDVAKAGAKAKSALPQFKQYREKDGQFYFKLQAADGSELMQSVAHASPRDAGERIAALKRDGAGALRQVEGAGLELHGQAVGALAAGANLDALALALAAFSEEGA
ncbi:MAG: tryptophan--tRNA ligase, partial [Arenimonas sp.]|nr:tryptophan--tRNA ligase [Arenimonas sp.]